MSVLRAEEQPEPSALPAALSQDSARSRAAARWTEPVAPTATAPGQATPPESADGPAIRLRGVLGAGSARPVLAGGCGRRGRAARRARVPS